MDTSEGSKEGMSSEHQGSGLHRMIILGSYALNLQVTITPKYNHLVPVTGQLFSNDPDNHL